MRKNQSEEWTDFTQLFIYFITVNKYRFCISVIRYINMQIIGIVIKNQYRSITTCFKQVSCGMVLELYFIMFCFCFFHEDHL